ncbi:hypothetical protein OPKNFCMD_5857 [Methylobacterium crusticola]|uniref:Uncharacterized protein n=1 Tax=Methylobacterium crusticola TaxID=1697972 RepID=A0ABQ4R5X1_9HYPH|nr:hypothetical protein [Methylobacterium crusticola]GJD53086.1 hypothetical protein OPKNFCMD_5857 [Methylobacterium crusticola]
MADHPPGSQTSDRSVQQLATMNAQLALWAACSAEESPPLIEQFEAMGYEVRGKSREAIAEVLRHPPTRPPRS